MFKGKIRVYVGALLLVIAVLAGAGGYFYQQFFLSDKFLPGVKIAGISVQGCSPEEAKQKLQSYLDNAYAIPIVFYADDYQFSAVMRDVCKQVDVGQVTEKIFKEEKERDILSKITNLNGAREYDYPVPVSYDNEFKQEMLNKWNEILGQEAVDAGLDMDPSRGLVVIPEVSGRTVDITATFKQLPSQWGALEPVKAEISVIEQVPEVTAKDLEIMGELASYITWYKVAEIDRSHNLTKAANLINGKMVKSGKEFSFNKTVGPRTLATGFRDAPVIVGNTLEPGLGGGICQVSSTLYNACLLAGLDIVERHNHGLAVSYVPLGLDATVAYGASDFRFKNNTDYPVYIRALAGGGKLSINIYGHLEYKKNIVTSHVVDEIIPFEYRDEIDPEMKTGESRVDHKGFPGYVVRSFRAYYDNAEQLISSEMLARDRYKPFDEITYVGPPGVEEIIDPLEPPADGETDIEEDSQEEGQDSNNPEDEPEAESDEAEAEAEDPQIEEQSEDS